MAEPAQPFSLWVFDNFGKVYVSTEDLAVRRMYIDPDRLLFMFDILQLSPFEMLSSILVYGENHRRSMVRSIKMSEYFG